MVHGFDSISIRQILAMTCSVLAAGSLNRVPHSIQIFLLLTLKKRFLLNCVHLLLVHHSAQLSHTWSDLSRSLKVMIQKTKVLIYFILVFSYTYFWLGYLVDVTYSTSQELTLVVFFTKFVVSLQPLSKSRSVLPIAPGLLHC